MNDNRYCVIMCGGVGSRFWPYSRAGRPKQFIDFYGTGKSLLQMTVDRIAGIVPEQNIILMTNAAYADIIGEQLPALKPDQILLEPARRNTAPCIAWAAYHIAARNPEARIMVTPSDHLIVNTEEFRSRVVDAFDFIDTRDAILTMGIKPNRPETGYGYIQVDSHYEGNFNTVKTFTEKPNAELARVFLDSGEFYWNSGMFFWSAGTILDALRQHAPDIASIFDLAPDAFGSEHDETRFINAQYASCPSISIDFAVMEKAPNVFVQTVDFGWSDLGTWGALYEHSPKNNEQNVTQGSQTLLYDCRENIIAAPTGKIVVASGLNGYIVADTPDALLIVPKSEEQRIRQYVNDVENKFGTDYL